MPSDALDVPSGQEAPNEAKLAALPELQSGPEQGLYESLMSPGAQAEVEAERIEWALPEGLTLAPEVSLDAHDPADVGGPRRLCVALARAGTRCRATAPRGAILCNAHAGTLDSSAGGHARAAKLRLVREGAENRAAAARLGTRGVVAEALREKHAEIRLAIHGLADRAASGDRAAALALIPWLNQGMGMPATSGSVEVSTPEGAMPLDALDTASLRALLASP